MYIVIDPYQQLINWSTSLSELISEIKKEHPSIVTNNLTDYIYLEGDGIHLYIYKMKEDDFILMDDGNFMCVSNFDEVRTKTPVVFKRFKNVSRVEYKQENKCFMVHTDKCINRIDIIDQNEITK